MDQSHNEKLIEIYKQTIDTQAEWENRMLILNTVYDVLSNFPDEKWDVHIAGSIVYGGLERGSDVDFSIGLKKKDESSFDVIERFSRLVFYQMIIDRDATREIHVYRIEVMPAVIYLYSKMQDLFII